jgi:hypothetical protein
MPSIDNSVCRSLLLVSICCTPAFADAPGSLSPPPSGRETFLAAAIAAMMLLGVTKYALFGRMSERTHVAIALLGVLIGGFALLVLFGGFLYQNPHAAAIMLLLLVALFKLMSQIETSRRPTDKK